MKVARTVVVLGVFTLISSSSMAQNLEVSEFDQLKEPKISTKQNQKMIVVEAKGDPNTVAGKAFGLLYRLYYSTPGTPKGLTPPSARARWPVSFETPKAEWFGLYALPVPDTVTKLPQYEPQEGIKASLTTWEYGEVAEILHVGPYDKEQPTVKRLKDFVKEKGYVIVGDPEEEYIKGPGMFGKGDPEKYITIIRFQVQKSDKK